MSQNIFKRARNALNVLNGTIDPEQMIPIVGQMTARVVRDGEVIYEKTVDNIVVRQGLNRLAYRAISNVGSLMNWIAIGTQTAAHSLDSVQAGIGEVGRKPGVTVVQSREWFSAVATWAGNADSLTGVVIDTGALTDYVNSQATPNIIFNAANGLGVTLQASDFLNLTVAIRVGSHNLSHSS